METRSRIPQLTSIPGTAVLLAALLLGGLAVQPTNAQWLFRAGASAAYDDNPMAVAGTSGSAIYELGAGFDRSLKGGGVGYSLNYLRYNQLSSVDAIVGNGYAKLSSNFTTAGVLVEHRNGTEERLYDYTGLTGVVSHMKSITGITSTFQFRGNVYRFPLLAERDRQTLSGATSFVKSLRTKTTILINMGAGYTVYTGDVGVDNNPSVWQQTASLRLAQSVTPTSGLAVQGLIRHLSGDIPSEYTVDDDGISYALLDDPSLYGLRTISAEFTKMLFDFDFTLKLGAFHTTKDYLTQGSYEDESTYDDSQTRRDVVNAAWFSVNYARMLVGTDLDINLGGQWSDNASNSYWYRYSGSYLSLGLQYNF